jgi:hypothetical protein
MFPLFLIFLLTMPTQGDNIMIGGSDLVLASTFNSRDIRITFNFDTTSSVHVAFYHDLCSEVNTVEHSIDANRQVQVTQNKRYIIDQRYFVSGSEVVFSFSSPAENSDPDPSSCVARVHIFQRHSDFARFILTQEMPSGDASYCIPHSSTVNFTLSAEEKSMYYFIGLWGSASTTIDYSITGRILEYIADGLSTITCTFPLKEIPSSGDIYDIQETEVCVIDLDYPSDQEICVLVSLQQSESYFNDSLWYSHPEGNKAHTIATWIIGVFCASIVPVCLLFICCSMCDLTLCM